MEDPDARLSDAGRRLRATAASITPADGSLAAVAARGVRQRRTRRTGLAAGGLASAVLVVVAVQIGAPSRSAVDVRTAAGGSGGATGEPRGTGSAAASPVWEPEPVSEGSGIGASSVSGSSVQGGSVPGTVDQVTTTDPAAATSSTLPLPSTTTSRLPGPTSSTTPHTVPQPDFSTTTRPVTTTTTSPPAGTSMTLAEARAAWEAHRPQRYTITLRRECFCAPEYVGPTRITVDGTTIVSAVVVETGAAVPTQFRNDLTIDGMYAYATAMAAQGQTVVVTVHVGATAVHPLVIDVDPESHPVDGGVIYEILTFEAG